MHRRLVERLRTAADGRPRSLLSPLLVGLGIWMGFPSPTAYQDMTSLVSGLESPGTRWNAYIEKSVAGSVQVADMPFTDSSRIPGSLSGAGIELPGVGTVAFTAKRGIAAETPDEDRVVRAGKAGRVMRIAPVAPPKNFSAGSLFERTSYLLRPSMNSGMKLAFAKPKIKGEEVQIASTFHIRETREPDFDVPPMLAKLFNDNKPDVLATAYAPAEPDYAKASPFEVLLKDKKPNAGRFIPPMSKGDHAWMENPLPPSVFSKKEQSCLADAIYFEARSESMRGQAAVAQVVLNRVRNPAYPNSICGVVYQNEDWRNACQFSFACDGRREVVNSPSHYKLAKEIAMAVTAGKIFLPEVGSATHYYANYVHPAWARTMHRMTKIGLHIFYRTYGGGWS